MNRRRLKIYSTLAVLFIFSIIVRLPSINRPLSFHHEWLTATSLRILQIWKAKGIRSYKFNPVMTWPTEANKYINNNASRHLDSDGNFYYTSYPPFGFILPYFIFSVLKVESSVLSIQVFNLILHFASALGIYLIAEILLPNKLKKNESGNKLALLAYSFYLFLPNPAWFQSNVYLSDMLAQPFWIFSLLISLKLLRKKDYKSLGWSIVLFIVNFLATYTEWLAYFFSFAFIVALFFSYKKKWLNKKRVINLSLIISCSAILALCLMLYQYSQIAGLNKFIESATLKYIIRSGVSEQSDFGLSIFKKTAWLRILNHYTQGYYPILVFAAILIFIYVKSKNSRPLRKRLLVKEWQLFTMLSLLPIVLHHLVFFNFTAVHDFSVLKSSVPLVIFTMLIYQKTVIATRKTNRVSKTNLINIFAFFLILISIKEYRHQNSKLDHYKFYQNLGYFIKENSPVDKPVFLLSRKKYRKLIENQIDPHIILYAKRNIMPIFSMKDAEEFLKARGLKEGVVFYLDNQEVKSMPIRSNTHEKKPN